MHDGNTLYINNKLYFPYLVDYLTKFRVLLPTLFFRVFLKIIAISNFVAKTILIMTLFRSLPLGQDAHVRDECRGCEGANAARLIFIEI